MHVILTGATGLVGSAVLDSMLRTADITRISILSRRPVKMAEERRDPRVNVILHSDFGEYDSALLERLRGARACVWALGISQTKVGRDEYVRITRDYALAAARSLSGLSEEQSPPDHSESDSGPFRFVYVSGEGATQTPGALSAVFARVKGETESALAEMASAAPERLRVDSVRPAYVDAARHGAILPYLPRAGMMECAAGGVMSLLVKVAPSMHSPTEALGGFLTRLAMGRVDDRLEGEGAFKLGPSWVVGNVGIRRIIGL